MHIYTEFRKMVMTTLYAREQKRHRCIEQSFPHFLIGLFVFLALSYMSCLHILEINPLSVVSFAIIFSHSKCCLYTLLIVSFAVQKLLSLIRQHSFTFVLNFHYSKRWAIEDLALIYVIECSLCFPLRVL